MEKVVSRKSHKLQIVGSTPTPATSIFGVWRSLASAPGLGPGGPRFESLYSDQFNKKATMTREEDQAATDAALAEFLANGGVVQQLKPNQSGRVEGESYSMWSKKKPSTSPLAKAPEDDE